MTTPVSTPAVATPKPRDEDLDFFGITHQGLVRKENQDHFLFSTLHKTMRVGGTSLPNPELLELPSQRLASFGLVADGVGGRAGGEAASRVATEALALYVTQAMESFYTQDADDEANFLRSLTQAAGRAHEAVLQKARAEGQDRPPATTMTAIIAIWPRVYILHVGDSRFYRYRNGRVEQLTRDQTMAQDLVDAGALPAERAPASPFSRILSSSLGGETTRPVVSTADLRPGDVLLLCTDGLTKHVTDARIAERLQQLTSSEQAARGLLDDALAGGGSDNVTVVVMRAIVR
ncbi:MAG TPA: PP2C family serine/threonine-protein phosphatase [Gemmatimonadales bacterium]